MQVSASTLLKSKRPAVGKLKIGDRVTFAGNVLRVLPGESRPLLILLEGNGQKITVASASIPNGAKLKGGDRVELFGAIMRIGESLVDEFVPVSLAVEGWTAARTTMSMKSVRKARG